MIKRWLIRSLFLLPLLCVVGVWVPSYWQMAGVIRNVPPHVSIWQINCGSFSFVDLQEWLTAEKAEIWGYAHAEADLVEARVRYLGSEYHFIGFAYDAPSPILKSREIIIPHWFPTLLLLVLNWLVWRKTRARLEGRAFPVEPAAKPGELKS